MQGLIPWIKVDKAELYMWGSSPVNLGDIVQDDEGMFTVLKPVARYFSLGDNYVKVIALTHDKIPRVEEINLSVPVPHVRKRDQL